MNQDLIKHFEPIVIDWVNNTSKLMSNLKDIKSFEEFPDSNVFYLDLK